MKPAIPDDSVTSTPTTYTHLLSEYQFTQQLSKNTDSIVPTIQQKQYKFLESRLDFLSQSKIQLPAKIGMNL